MGKHERGVVQQVEESIVAILKGHASLLPARHPWHDHDVRIAQRLMADFSPTDARHIGNHYDTPGDILLAADQAEFVIEIKVSDTVAGVGTAANISQDALTKYGIIPNTEAWSSWRRRREYAQGMSRILDEWPPARRASSISEKGRIVRDAAPSTPQARHVKDVAVAYANVDRSEYGAMLRTRPVDAARLREFVLALFMGAHTSAEIEQLIASGLPTSAKNVPDNYYVYFTNVQDQRISVRRHTPEIIKRLLDVTDFRLELYEAQHSGRITGMAGDVRVELLTFIHHWKNVFVGIQTPCINVFMGAYPKHLLQTS